MKQTKSCSRSVYPLAKRRYNQAEVFPLSFNQTSLAGAFLVYQFGSFLSKEQWQKLHQAQETVVAERRDSGQFPEFQQGLIGDVSRTFKLRKLTVNKRGEDVCPWDTLATSELFEASTKSRLLVSCPEGCSREAILFFLERFTRLYNMLVARPGVKAYEGQGKYAKVGTTGLLGMVFGGRLLGVKRLVEILKEN